MNKESNKIVNKKKKVLMYYTFENEMGGPVTYIKTIVNSPLKEKYEFAECYQNTAPGGINIGLLKKMVARIKDESPDILHIHGLQSEGLYGVVAGRLAGVPEIVMAVHGFSLDSEKISKAKRWVYRYLVEPFEIRHSDEIYCVCEAAQKRDIIQKSLKRRQRCGVIHNCIPELKAERSRSEVRGELGFTEDDTVFVIASRINTEKGYKILGEAFKRTLSKGCGSCKLLVLGEGDYAEEFAGMMEPEISAGQVVMFGRCDCVPDYLNACDVFIMPSYHENMPLSVIEAGQMGLPCIVSDVGGIPEIIKDSETGYIIHGFDPDDYAEAMCRFINDKALLKKMSEAVKLDVSDRFSLKTMCDKLVEVYG